MGYTKDQLISRLEELKINFTLYDHPVVMTVEEQEKYVGHLGGALSKNLFLKDKKNRVYIVSALSGTKVDLKLLSQRLGLGKGGLRMAPEGALLQVLQVPLGCVTPFALINESASEVSLLLDQGFKAHQLCYFHPLTNDVTIAVSASGLDKFLLSIGRNAAYVDLEASPVVGKDSPPDLASLVPSGVPNISDEGESVAPAQLTDQNTASKEKPVLPAANSQAKHQKAEKPQPSKKDPPPRSTDVQAFVTQVLGMISSALLLEAPKSNVELNAGNESDVLDAIRRRVGAELDGLAMTLKNAAYTEGFHAGFETMLSTGLKGRPSKE